MFEYNEACRVFLAPFTVTGNSWQQECSLSLLICLYRNQLHYWLAGFFIQQLPVNKSCCQTPSYPPPLISRDLHLTSLWTRTIALSPLERVNAAFSGALASSLKGDLNCWSNLRWSPGKAYCPEDVLFLLRGFLIVFKRGVAWLNKDEWMTVKKEHAQQYSTVTQLYVYVSR